MQTSQLCAISAMDAGHIDTYTKSARGVWGLANIFANGKLYFTRDVPEPENLPQGLEPPAKPAAKPAPNHYQPPSTTNHQPPTTTNCHQPPVANCQPPIATNRQPPTANRQPPPTMVEHMECPRAVLPKLWNGTLFFSVKDRPAPKAAKPGAKRYAAKAAAKPAAKVAAKPAAKPAAGEPIPVAPVKACAALPSQILSPKKVVNRACASTDLNMHLRQ